MRTLRRYAYAVFGVACLHLVFGAIVRISGSGMGCGDHWPKCYGRWFPPLSRPDLIIEVSHRYLASILLLSLIGLLVAAWNRRPSSTSVDTAACCVRRGSPWHSASARRSSARSR